MDSIADIPVIRLESEGETLEAKLIKYRPFFNIALKMADKYPTTSRSRKGFPRIVVTVRGRTCLYFGPFVNAEKDVRSLLRLVNAIFPCASARDLRPRSGEEECPSCLQYSLGRCLGPCGGLVTPSVYQERVDDVILLLRGSLRGGGRLRKRMDKAAGSLAFEEAGRLRDTIRAIWRITRQRITSPLREDFDGDMWQVPEPASAASRHARPPLENRAVSTFPCRGRRPTGWWWSSSRSLNRSCRLQDQDGGGVDIPPRRDGLHNCITLKSRRTVVLIDGGR
ncbi:hypothetical protein MASR2M79_14380 [Aminivibrio sp.]